MYSRLYRVATDIPSNLSYKYNEVGNKIIDQSGIVKLEHRLSALLQLRLNIWLS